MAKRKLSEYEVAIICEHLDNMIDACNEALLRYRSIPRKHITDKIKRTIDYWKDARAGFYWAQSIARQRKHGAGNVNRSTIQ